jgi:hypothetical protein
MQTPIRLETDSEASARMIWNCLFRQKDARKGRVIYRSTYVNCFPSGQLRCTSSLPSSVASPSVLTNCMIMPNGDYSI